MGGQTGRQLGRSSTPNSEESQLPDDPDRGPKNWVYQLDHVSRLVRPPSSSPKHLLTSHRIFLSLKRNSTEPRRPRITDVTYTPPSPPPPVPKVPPEYQVHSRALSHLDEHYICIDVADCERDVTYEATAAVVPIPLRTLKGMFSNRQTD